MTDREGFFERFEGELPFGAESEVAGLIREQRETVVGEDRRDAPEFREDEERRLVGREFEMHDAVVAAAEAGTDGGYRQLVFLVFGQETFVGASNRSAVTLTLKFQIQEIFRRNRGKFRKGNALQDRRRIRGKIDPDFALRLDSAIDPEDRKADFSPDVLCSRDRCGDPQDA